ncbi:DgyrCDS1988 [Dimorphilus gyrociliatus]|uniref:(S)-2-hydroxy-acid oxidase n=1 Tax=Dimorphilus gyrociliatus TaxID=2664684 RepID=A0A7I8V959_9ANNE|nr:DgyrCDS1988 [Dimorphilus gyrociliatus]
MASEKVPFSLDDIEKAAKKKMEKDVADYIYGGADQHQGVVRNQKVMKEILLNPKVCANLSTRDLSTTILGYKISMPIGFSPTGCREWVIDDGETYAAKSAASWNIPFSLSSFTEIPLEMVNESMKEFGDPLRIMQMSVYPEEAMTKEIIKRVEKCGFQAIVLTLDHPVHGRRSFDGSEGDDPWEETGLPNLPEKLLLDYEKSIRDGTLEEIETSTESWQDITKIKRMTKLKVIAKGIARPNDALEAIKAGADAIWISNHGGRQLGDGPATIDCLRRIAPVVKQFGVEIYIDGGFRSGNDVLKALALGARCIFIGRPVLSALAVKGEEGVSDMLKIMKRELDISMALCGCRNIEEVSESILWT